jgi:hypothetical protein
VSDAKIETVESVAALSAARSFFEKQSPYLRVELCEYDRREDCCRAIVEEIGFFDRTPRRYELWIKSAGIVALQLLGDTA